MIERLPHGALDADPVDVADREHLRIQPAQQVAFALVERAHAEERDAGAFDRRHAPAVREGVAAEPQRRGEDHAVHVAGR